MTTSRGIGIIIEEAQNGNYFPLILVVCMFAAPVVFAFLLGGGEDDGNKIIWPFGVVIPPNLNKKAKLNNKDTQQALENCEILHLSLEKAAREMCDHLLPEDAARIGQLHDESNKHALFNELLAIYDKMPEKFTRSDAVMRIKMDDFSRFFYFLGDESKKLDMSVQEYREAFVDSPAARLNEIFIKILTPLGIEQK